MLRFKNEPSPQNGRIMWSSDETNFRSCRVLGGGVRCWSPRDKTTAKKQCLIMEPAEHQSRGPQHPYRRFIDVVLSFADSHTQRVGGSATALPALKSLAAAFCGSAWYAIDPKRTATSDWNAKVDRSPRAGDHGLGCQIGDRWHAGLLFHFNGRRGASSLS